MSTQAKDKKDKIEMHPIWGKVWGGWFFTWVFLEILAGFLGHQWIFGWFLVFLPNELQGAGRKRWSKAPKGKRKEQGDTLSEFVWTFTQGGTSRDWAGRFLALSLGMRMMSFPWLFDKGDEIEFVWGAWETMAWETDFLIYTPFVLLSMGITLWLLEHFPREGRTG